MVHRYKDAHPGVILRIGGGSEFQLWIPEMVSGRNPDLAIAFRGAPRDQDGRRPPFLVAEVVSGGRASNPRDYETKREEYLVFGLREYWIVDPRSRQVTVLVRAEEAGRASWTERVFRGEEVIEGSLLPGFPGTVAHLWADVEPDEDDGDDPPRG